MCYVLWTFNLSTFKAAKDWEGFKDYDRATMAGCRPLQLICRLHTKEGDNYRNNTPVKSEWQTCGRSSVWVLNQLLSEITGLWDNPGKHMAL